MNKEWSKILLTFSYFVSILSMLISLINGWFWWFLGVMMLIATMIHHKWHKNKFNSDKPSIKKQSEGGNQDEN